MKSVVIGLVAMICLSGQMPRKELQEVPSTNAAEEVSAACKVVEEDKTEEAPLEEEQ